MRSTEIPAAFLLAMLTACSGLQAEESITESAVLPATTPCGVLERREGFGVIFDQLADSLDLYGNPLGKITDATTSICSSVQAFFECRQAGGSILECHAPGIAEGLCNFFGNGLLNATHPMTVFARHYAQVVDPYELVPEASCGEQEEAPPGESSLHCCKYSEDQVGCHSGFAAPSINCTIDYGRAQLNHLGLPTCEGYAECSSSSSNPGSPLDNDPPTMEQVFVQLQRNYLGKVASAYDVKNPIVPPSEDDAGEPSACTSAALFDLGTFRGCRGWLEMMREARPFAGSLSSWVVDGDEIDPSAAPQVSVGLMSSHAAGRIILGVPNGVDRLELAVARQTQNYATTAEAYIASQFGNAVIDEEAELRKWLSPCALELLKSVLKQGWWRMMAYPTSLETATTLNHALYEDACVVGGAPRIIGAALADGASPGEKQLRVSASDPERTTFAFERRTAIAFEDDDGNLVTRPFIWDERTPFSTNVYPYPFDGRLASPVIDVILINTAGKVDLRDEDG